MQAVTGGSSSIEHQDLPPSVPNIQGHPTDVYGIVDIFPWGPMSQATKVYSWPHHQEIFGGLLKDYEGPIQVKQYFSGGGHEAVIVRTCHLDVNGQPVSARRARVTLLTGAVAATGGFIVATGAAPYALANADTIIGKVDNDPAVQTATITAAAAVRSSVSVEPFALTDGMILKVKINGGTEQQVTFRAADFAAIGAATAEEVAAVLDAALTGCAVTSTGGGTLVTITTDRKGTGASVQITGGNANTVLAFSTVIVSGTGNVFNVDSVTIAELKAIIEAAFGGYSLGVTVSDASGYLKIASDETGLAACIQITVASTADSKIGLDNANHCGTDGSATNTLLVEGKYYGIRGNNFAVKIAAASNGQASYFDLTVYENGVWAESWKNGVVDSTSDDYIVTKINAQGGSKLLQVTDLAAPGGALNARPANIASAPLADGDDGLAGLTETDFEGTVAALTGLYALENESDADTCATPSKTTSTMHELGRDYGHTYRSGKVVYIPDPPPGATKAAMVAHVAGVTASDKIAGFLWPKMQIANPDKSVYGTSATITIGLSGSYVARMALNSRNQKKTIAVNPSNNTFGVLAGGVALEGEVVGSDKSKHAVNWKSTRDYVTPYRINPVRSGKLPNGSFGVWVDDCMTFDGSSPANWKSIGEMRMACQVRRDVDTYLETVRTQGHSIEERENDHDRIETYMVGHVLAHRLATQKASDAFYVITDPQGKDINSPLVQYNEQYFVIVGMATQKARRFITLALAQDQRALDAYIQSQMNS